MNFEFYTTCFYACMVQLSFLIIELLLKKNTLYNLNLFYVKLFLYYTVLKKLLVINNFLPKRSEEHTSELQSLMRISYAVFCLKKKKKTTTKPKITKYYNRNNTANHKVKNII